MQTACLSMACALMIGCAGAGAGADTARRAEPAVSEVRAASAKSAADTPSAANGPNLADSGSAPVGATAEDVDTSGVVGHVPSEWEASQWFNSSPLTLAGLRGRVVFVRWFTDPSCPFCEGSAPALRALHERYARAGLVVVGMYHHKQETPLDPADVRGWARHYGYEFPVAIDADWRTLKRWWLDGHPNRGFTSVSFLIDRAGVVRRVHLGGLIDVNSDEFRAIAADTERLLAEKPALRSSKLVSNSAF